jgi:addiction module RelB/DinJ family antitoxin
MVNRELKENAEALFAYFGLNMSSAVNIFLRKAVEQKGMPFVINNESSFGGINHEEVGELFVSAVKNEIANKYEKGLPVARYDADSDRAYLENADGTREYV